MELSLREPDSEWKVSRALSASSEPLIGARRYPIDEASHTDYSASRRGFLPVTLHYQPVQPARESHTLHTTNYFDRLRSTNSSNEYIKHFANSSSTPPPLSLIHAQSSKHGHPLSLLAQPAPSCPTNHPTTRPLLSAVYIKHILPTWRCGRRIRRLFKHRDAFPPRRARWTYRQDGHSGPQCQKGHCRTTQSIRHSLSQYDGELPTQLRQLYR